MSNKSIHYIVAPVQLTAPAARAATVNSASFDREKGPSGDIAAPYEALEILFEFGAWTDGTHTPKLQDSPDGTTWTDVPAANLVGTLSAVTSVGTASTIQRAAYLGTQRYVRGVITISGATTGAVSGITAIAGYPRNLPTVASGN